PNLVKLESENMDPLSDRVTFEMRKEMKELYVSHTELEHLILVDRHRNRFDEIGYPMVQRKQAQKYFNRKSWARIALLTSFIKANRGHFFVDSIIALASAFEV